MSNNLLFCASANSRMVEFALCLRDTSVIKSRHIAAFWLSLSYWLYTSASTPISMFSLTSLWFDLYRLYYRLLCKEALDRLPVRSNIWLNLKTASNIGNSIVHSKLEIWLLQPTILQSSKTTRTLFFCSLCFCPKLGV